MENQLVTIKGIYQDGQIELLSPFLPKGGFEVLITFLAPIVDKEPAETGMMVAFLQTKEEIQESRLAKLGISKREFEIIGLVQKGFSNRDISAKLGIGDGTVRNYISALLDKLGAENRTQLVTIAIEKGLVDPSGN